MRSAAASGASGRPLRGVAGLSLVPLLFVAGCSLPAVGGTDEVEASSADFGRFDPVAVLEDEATRSRGVLDNPLEPGESLAFVFPRVTETQWTMVGVKYPLRLHALAEDGSVIESVDLTPGLCCQAIAPAAVYVEVRPRKRN